MRVLVLGASGFLGRHTVPALRADGHQVVTADRAHEGDLTVDALLRAVVDAAEADVVLNLVAAGLGRGTADTGTMAAVNAALPARLAALLAEREDTRLVHAASSTEGADDATVDESEYSRTKRRGTAGLREVAATSGLPTTIVRIHNTYGPDQPRERFVMSVVRALSARQDVLLQFPHRVRDFVEVGDVARGLAVAVAQPSDGIIDAELGTGTGLSLLDATEHIARAVAAPLDLVGFAAPLPVDRHPATVCPVPFGTFGTCTTPFEDGIAQVIAAASQEA